jgi:hypothetical protein
MSDEAQTDRRRDDEQTKRFDTEIDERLTEGDRVPPKLVARHPGQLGSPIQPPRPETDPEPDTQLLAVTEIHRHDDVHSAILLDPEREVFYRAGAHDSQQAWSQKEADWKVKGVGTAVELGGGNERGGVIDLERPEDEMDEDAETYAQTWLEILFDEIRLGYHDINDERKVEGDLIKLRDYDGRKLTARFELTEVDG